MEPTLQAILARFDGDHEKARDYCTTIAFSYPHLAKEYWAYREALLERSHAASV